MAEQKTQAVQKPKRRKPKKKHRVLHVFFSIILIGIFTAGFCSAAFAYYVQNYVEPEIEKMDISSVNMKFTSTILAKNQSTGEYQEYETLHGSENRVWVDLADIPKNLQNAFVAIEDQRFYTHHGVDWKRTFGAALSWVGGNGSYGGSTITQQLIKNLTDDDDYSVKRKITEIFRALTLEKKVDDKNKILEMYLNEIYLGNKAYGVNAAVQTYFNKAPSDLTLAECAVIAGITNNPSYYNPLRFPEHIKERQKTILDEMCRQGMITQSECDAAKAEQLVYQTAKQEDQKPYSYFTDTVIRDVTNDLVDKKGYSYDRANELVMEGGLQIYGTINSVVQGIMDNVYADGDNFPDATKNGMQLESAMIILTPKGEIAGVVGGRGTKTDSLTLNRATQSKRQPGSSIKPIAVYGPAMDAGLITPYSVVTDMPSEVVHGSAWPNNDNRRYAGQTVIRNAVAHSVNAVAVKVLIDLTPQASYDFLTEKLNFTTLNENSDINLAPLALGGLTNGATVREMAGGYTTFLNGGNFAEPHSYSKVLDHDGNVLLDNTTSVETAAFENEQTAYYMNEALQAVTSEGTAQAAQLGGIATAGKTGTTTEKKDLWFIGYTPYFIGACWTGYDREYDLSDISGNPSVTTWENVMERIHDGFPDASFPSYTDDFVQAEYCMDSGLKPDDACTADPRGSRVATGWFHKDDVPTTTCNLHKFFTLCRTSGQKATRYCPSSYSGALLDLTRKFPVSVEVEDQKYCFTGDNEAIGTGEVVSGGGGAGYCSIHTSWWSRFVGSGNNNSGSGSTKRQNNTTSNNDSDSTNTGGDTDAATETQDPETGGTEGGTGGDEGGTGGTEGGTGGAEGGTGGDAEEA